MISNVQAKGRALARPIWAPS